MEKSQMLTRLKQRFIEVNLLVVIAVVVFTEMISVWVGLFIKPWYTGILPFFALVAGLVIVIDQWPRISRLFSIEQSASKYATKNCRPLPRTSRINSLI